MSNAAFIAPLEPPTSVGQLFHLSEQQVFRRTDKVFFILFGIQWVAGILFALIVSPRAWAGSVSSVHPHLYAAIFLGGACCLVPMFFCWRSPGQAITRHLVAIGQTSFSALLIHLTGGRIESHFHVFGSLAFLACYRDWRVLLTATIVVAGDHFVRGIWYPMSVYGVMFASPWRVAEHALWVLFEDSILLWSCHVSRREMLAICEKEHQNRLFVASLENIVKERTAELQAEVVERRRVEAATRASEERYRALVVNSPQIIMTLDREFRIRFINRIMPGLSQERVIGSDFLAYHPERDQQALRPALNDVFEFGQTRTLEVIGPGPGGTTAWYSLTLAPLRSEDKIDSCIVLATDITLRHQSELELIKARDLAEAGNRAKSEFLATMSHELRTPMNGVIGFTSLLSDTPLNGDQREYVDTIQHSGEALLAIIDDILDLSKIEAGKFHLELAPVNLHKLATQVVQFMQPRAASKGLALVLRFEPDEKLMLHSDEGRVRQVLLNLIGNAIKFTDVGSVTVHVQYDPSSATRAVRVSVRDTGIGIPRDKHDRLFQKFSQVDGSMTRRFGGTGLGLVISKQLLELLGGTIGVESAPGHGSTFSFTHPVAQAASVAESPKPLAPAASKILQALTAPDASISYKVLLAEDNPVNQRVASLHLKKLGCVVDCAATGREAVEKFQQVTYDCIFMDVLMPEMDGLEATRRIRELQKHANRIPIFALTANAMQGDRARCLAAGMDDYITKPIHVSELQRVLQTWLPHPVPATSAPAHSA